MCNCKKVIKLMVYILIKSVSVSFEVNSITKGKLSYQNSEHQRVQERYVTIAGRHFSMV